MRSYTLTFAVLAVLAGAQEAPRRGRCHARPPRPSFGSGNGTLPSVSGSNVEVSSTLASDVPVPTDVESSSEDVTTVEASVTVTETSIGSSAASDGSESTAQEAASTPSSTSFADSSPVTSDLMITSSAVPVAEPSVVTTSASSAASAANSQSTIGGELAVPTTPSSSSSAAPQPSQSGSTNTTTPTPGAAGDKAVGLAVNGETGPLTSFVGGTSKMGWYYNWALDSNTDSAGLEYVPMVWGEASLPNVQASSQKWQDVTHVLGFNERMRNSPLLHHELIISDSGPELRCWRI